MQHRWAQSSAVLTVDDRPFLMARTGIIDICPAQSYLSQKLLPVYVEAQMGDIVTPFRAVPKETAIAESYPMPDWNYLRWGRYSDRKYQDLCSGKALLELSWIGEQVL